MHELRIRPYQSSDFAAVIRLWEECGLVVSYNNPQRDIERKLRVNPEWLLVGLVNDKLVASCMAGYEGHRGWINYLAVLPEYRRRGIARAMMREAERKLQAAGCPKIMLQIRETNLEVMQFYEKLGYAKDPVVSMGKRLEEDPPWEPQPKSTEPPNG